MRGCGADRDGRSTRRAYAGLARESRSAPSTGEAKERDTVGLTAVIVLSRAFRHERPEAVLLKAESWSGPGLVSPLKLRSNAP